MSDKVSQKGSFCCLCVPVRRKSEVVPRSGAPPPIESAPSLESPQGAPRCEVPSVTTSHPEKLAPAAAAPRMQQVETKAVVAGKATSDDLPSWVDEKFVEGALRTKHPEVVVTSLHVVPAVAKGENYGCNVFQAQAETSQGTFKLFLKCMPETEVRVKLVRDGEIMTREIDMYERTLPMLRGTGATPSYPDCMYAFHDDVRDTLVLEDLSLKGYRTYPRQLGLDAAHCGLALTELAHLHGYSVALRIQNPEKFKIEIQEKYVDSVYTEKNSDIMNAFYYNSIPPLSESIRNNLPFRFNEIADILDGLISTAFLDTLNILKLPESNEKLSKMILTMNHGDFWSNNILFQYKEDLEEPLACSLVDFQLSRCASPALDLLYFFYTSTTQATRRAHMDALLQLYLHEARQAMHERGVADPGGAFYRDVAHIKQDMHENAMFGFLVASFILPVVIANATDAPDFESFTEDNQSQQSAFSKLYSGPLFCLRMKELIEDFDNMGFFAEQKIRQDKTKLNTLK